MVSGVRYRVLGVVGTAALTTLVVSLVNNATVLSLATAIPVIGDLPVDTPDGPELVLEVLTATVVFVAAMVPLYKPRPRRVLDVAALAQKRVVLAMVGLAAIGYFDYTYRLPRMTVLLSTPLLLVALPAWFAWIRRRPSGSSRRAIVVGDDVDRIRQVVEETPLPLFGYLCPTRVFVEAPVGTVAAVTDGGVELERLGGLSGLEDVLVDYDVDTAILAFERADRAEFFGALDACYDHGVDAKVHAEQADSVLTAGGAVGTFVDVEIEPWDVQDYLVKRGFDVAFAVVGLVVLAPVALSAALAIALEDGGSILYRQERTAVFGETFAVYKFRTMVEGAEDETGPVISHEDGGKIDRRVTRVGRALRTTHLDEIPQLWSVLVGDMSVVGPRPERPELDSDIQAGVADWQKRWFVKPGLTGLAQVNNVTGGNPALKLRYDLEYVRRQSFWFDVEIVVRQLWLVCRDIVVAVPVRST